MFFVIFWTALVRYTWLSNSSRFFSDNQYFRMFLVSMADTIGSYERSRRCENNIVQTVAAAQGFLSRSDGNKENNGSRREQWLTSLTVWTVHSICTYMIFIYIYRYISLSIYRSIFLYLFWLADIFASVERPDNKSLHLADMILIKLSNLLLGARQHHTTSGSVLFFALAAHGRKVRKPAVPGSTPGKKKQYRLYTLCPCCVSPTMRCGRLPSRSDVNTLQTEVLIGNIYIYIQ